MSHPGYPLDMVMAVHADVLRDAAQRRLAQQVRGPRGVRHQVGRLLISAGEALIRRPVETARTCPETV